MSNLNKGVVVGIVSGVVVAISIILLFFSFTGPKTTDLDNDIASLDSEISSAKAETAKYGGVVGLQAELRLEALLNTRAMLEQKRKSIFRGVQLNYVIDGHAWRQPSLTELLALKADWDNAESEAQTAEAKAASMGGLIGTLALMAAETDEVTAAFAEARYKLAKAGMPVLGVTTKSQTPSPSSP